MKTALSTLPVLRWSLAALLLALLGGCASSVGERTTRYPEQPPAQTGIGTVRPAPQPTAPAPNLPIPITPGNGSPVAIAPPPKAPEYPKSAEAISGQAVLSLMKQAREARAAGKFDQASGALERAQRIEPRNYFVWSALSRVYLDKKLYDNAESVAMKSNSLARGNIYVELENWKVISEAREAQGDSIGALQAQSRIDEIQRNLIGSGG